MCSNEDRGGDAVAELIAGLEGVLGADPGELADDTLAARLPVLRRLVDLAEAAFLRSLAAFDARGLAAADGAASTQAWLRGHARMHPGQAKERVTVGRALHGAVPGGALDATAAALADGRISYPHAAVLAGQLSRLPAELDPDLRADAEAALVNLATEHDPAGTALLAKRLRDLLDPDLANRDLLAARARRRLTIAATLDGVHLNGFLDPEAGELIQTALRPLAAPQPGPDGQPDPRSSEQRTADALVELARRALDHGDPPSTGGLRPHLSLIVPWPSVRTTGEQPRSTTPSQPSERSPSAGSLLIPAARADATAFPEPAGQTGGSLPIPRPRSPLKQPHRSAPPPSSDPPDLTETLDFTGPPGVPGAPDFPGPPDPFAALAAATRAGTPARAGWGAVLPIDTARRYACDAEITRIVIADQPALLDQLRAGLPTALGGAPPEILDLGRTQRLASRAQRRALEVRDGGCVFPGCGRPPGWCDAHHLWHWIDGGPSDLWNLALLCRWHHTFMHEGGWRLDRDPDGRFTATPPDDHRLRRLTVA
jgi:hypothetical protein